MDVRDYLLRIQADAAAALALLAPSSIRIVRAGDNLQAALDAGGNIQLEGGTVFNGSFIASKPGTKVFGAQAKIVGFAHGPAIFIPPGTRDIQVVLESATTMWDQAVVLVGNSDSTQTQVSHVPDNIQLSINIPTHRGKRAFYINGSNVVMRSCGCRDVFDPAGRDSQGIVIFNTPGPVTVDGGTFEAGSENILVGGDPTAIPNVVPTNLLFQNLTLSRPDWWRTDGISRKVKNLFELKAGIDVKLINAVLDGCWTDGQTGWAIMLTPRDGKTIKNLLFQDVTIKNAGGALAMIGYDDMAPSPQLVGVTMLRVNANVHSSRGSGRFAQWQGGPKNVRIEDCIFAGDKQIIYANPDGVTWDAQGVKGKTSITEGVMIVNNQFESQSYGISVNGYIYGKNWLQGFPAGVIEGNILSGPTAISHKGNIPASNILNP